MFSINTNLGALAALQSLQATNNALTDTQNQISTGKKVSSAADNPAVYAISQSMNADIAGLTAVQDNLSFAAQVVNTASTSVSQISSTLATLKQNITQAQSQGVSASQMNQNISDSLSQIDTFANSATYNGVNLISGAVGNGVNYTQLNVLSDTHGNSFTVGASGTQALNATSSGLGLSGLNANQTGLQFSLGSIDGSTFALSGNGAAATSITLKTASSNTASAQNPSQTWTFVLNDKSGSDGLLNALASGNDANGAPLSGDVTADGSGGLSVTAAGKGMVSSKDLGNGNTLYSIAQSVDANGNATSVINIVSVNVQAESSSLGAGAGNQPSQSAALNNLTDAMNSVGFNASRDSSNNLSVTGNNLDTSADDNTAAVQNLTNSTGSVGATQLTGATAAIATVTAAINKLGNISTTLGAGSQQITGMQSFTSALSSALTAGVGALTDADLASESAKLQSLQTKQSLAMQALSIANQQPQSLMTLFR